MDCMHQIGPTGRKLERLCHPHALQLHVRNSIGRCVKTGVILHQTWSETKRQYCWDILLS